MFRNFLAVLLIAHSTCGLAQPKIGIFEKWLDARGIERNVIIHDDTSVGGGRGLIASCRLEPGVVAAFVPVSATLRLEGGPYDEDDNWAGVLASNLMHQAELGTGSQYAEYVDLGLPKEAPLTPCRWSTRERSSLQSEKFIKECLENSFWRRKQAIAHGGSNNKSFMRMLDLVCSRTLRGRDGSRQLVPLIDMANHAPEEAGGGHFAIDEKGNVALIVGRKGIDEGQPVTMDYGARTVEEFLLHYGFVPDRCSSDIVHVERDGELVPLSWADCVGYRGHQDPYVREAALHKLQSFPTSLKDDVSIMNGMQDVISEALRSALSYRLSKKSLLACLAGSHDYLL